MQIAELQAKMTAMLRKQNGSPLAAKRARLIEQAGRFRQLYGEGEVNILRAPARINILGEHVDYVAYLPTASLPFASREHEMMMLFRAAPNHQVRGASMRAAFTPFNFSLDDGDAPSLDQARQLWTAYLFSRAAPAPDWSNYVKGAAYFARWKYGQQIRRGFDFLVDSTIPPSGGASSSSALSVLAGACIREVNHIAYQMDELAHDSSQAEWFQGTRGGAMDQTTICLARQHHAVHITYPEVRARLVPMPDAGFRWVTFFSHPADKGREVMLAYNERSAVSRLLIPALIANWQDNRPALAEGWARALQAMKSDELTGLDQIESLLSELPVEITLADFARHNPQTFIEFEQAFPTLAEAWQARPLKLRDRARHHVSEARRVVKAVRLLGETFVEQADKSTTRIDDVMRELGALINESHASLRDLYDVCTPEVNRLIEIVRADSQVYGARLMGGGFGGNVLALTRAATVAPLIERVQREFYAPRKRDALREGAVMVSTPGDGLSAINPREDECDESF
jgi:N-acetylgalactosamine kinase